MMDFFSSGIDHSAQVGFYALAAVAIFASLRVVTQSNPVHAILSMIVSLLSVAGIFFILGAPFAGALEIIVYAGAILVLFVFVIMMLNLGMANEAREKSWLSSSTWAVPTGLTLIIAVVLYAMIGLGSSAEPQVQAHQALVEMSPAVIGAGTVSAKAVGVSLFTQYLMLVELAALILLGALVAAYHLGKRALDDENDSHKSQRLYPQGGPLSAATDDQLTESETEPYQYQSINATDYIQDNTLQKKTLARVQERVQPAVRKESD